MKKGLIFFIVYILFGLYFLNRALVFWEVPEVLLKVDIWISFIGGILLILAGLFAFRITKKTVRL